MNISWPFDVSLVKQVFELIKGRAMSNKPQKIRRIFNVLKDSVEKSFSDREILELSNAIIKSQEEASTDVSHRDYQGPVPFYQKDLVEVLEDGGWQLLTHEKTLLAGVYSDF